MAFKHKEIEGNQDRGICYLHSADNVELECIRGLHVPEAIRPIQMKESTLVRIIHLMDEES